MRATANSLMSWSRVCRAKKHSPSILGPGLRRSGIIWTSYSLIIPGGEPYLFGGQHALSPRRCLGVGDRSFIMPSQWGFGIIGAVWSVCAIAPTIGRTS
jgi:hypothetical protein